LESEPVVQLTLAVGVRDFGEPCLRNKKSPIGKYSLVINGHKTSVSLEEEFWRSLCEIATDKNVRSDTLIEQIDAKRTTINLSSAIRVFVLKQYRRAWLKTRKRK